MGLPGRKPAGRRKRIRARPQSGGQKPRVSPTYFKDHVDPRNYSFGIYRGWTHRHAKHVAGVFGDAYHYPSSGLHLVLSDRTGTPRFSLGYEQHSDGWIEIHSIMREWTKGSYVLNPENPGAFLPDGARETAASKRFQKQLGEMHPAEFLLSEFIFKHRRAILKKRHCFFQPEGFEG